MYMTCSIPDCQLPIRYTSLCNKHYQRIRKYGDPNVDKKRTRNSLSKLRLYRIWVGMKSRCFDVSNDAYYRYGGRGITVCNDWAGSLENFILWANNAGYSDDLSIERKNNDGNYEPSNCKWATRKEQCNNRRSNTIVEYQGQELNIGQWADKLGWTRETIENRLRRGWTVERVFSQKPRRSPQRAI